MSRPRKPVGPTPEPDRTPVPTPPPVGGPAAGPPDSTSPPSLNFPVGGPGMDLDADDDPPPTVRKPTKKGKGEVAPGEFDVDSELTERQREDVASIMHQTRLDPARYVQWKYGIENVHPQVIEKIVQENGLFMCPTCSFWRATDDRTRTGCKYDGKPLNG